MICIPSQTKQSEDYKINISEDSDDSIFEEDYLVDAEQIHLEKETWKSSSLTDSLEKVGRFLFAEDLVSYVASEFHGITYAVKIKKDPEILYNPFNETVRRAVNFIRWRINKVNCPSFEIIKKLSTSHQLFFECFADAVLGHYSEKGLKAGIFLFYCVYFAELASRCYETEFKDILDFAVYAILDAFCMLSEGRYQLNSIAKNFIGMSENRSLYWDYNPLSHIPSEISALQGQTFNESGTHMYSFNEENQLEKIQACLEDLKLVDDEEIKSKVICNSQLTVIENTEPEFKSFECSRKEADFPSTRDGIVSDTDKACLVDHETLPFSPKTQSFEDFVLEAMSVVNFEALLFSAIYSAHENQIRLDSQEDSHIENEEGNLEATKCLTSSNSEIKESNFVHERLKSPSIADGEAETITQPVTSDSVSIQRACESKSIDSNDNLEYEDARLPNIKSKSLEFVQDHLTSQSIPLAHNKVADLTTQPVENFTKLESEENIKNFEILDRDAITPVGEKDQPIETFLAVYKPEGEASEENLIVLKGECLLFAEDLIRYIVKKFYNTPFSESKFEENRDLLYNAFNETVTEAIDHIRGEIEAVTGIVFDVIANVEEHRTVYYRKYVAAVLSHYTLDGINSDIFLYYCLHFSELAMKCCTLDTSVMSDFAIYSILDAFCLLKHDWNEFNVSAERIVRLSKEFTIEKDYYQQKGILSPTNDAYNFESECLKIILSSLKEIHGLCTESKEDNFFGLKQKVEELLTTFKTADSIELSKTPEKSNTNILEQNYNETITVDENEQVLEKVEDSTNSSSASKIKYLQNLTLEVCSIISFEAAKLSKEILPVT